MFEQEAKEWVKTKGTDAITCLNENIGWDDVCEQAFIDGAEFGYNKANEWHYVKDELPPKDVPLCIVTLDKNKKKKLWVGEYNGGNGKWWTGYFNIFIDEPFAWKEFFTTKGVNRITDLEIVVFNDKSWVRLTEYQKVKEENEQLQQKWLESEYEKSKLVSQI